MSVSAHARGPRAWVWIQGGLGLALAGCSSAPRTDLAAQSEGGAREVASAPIPFVQKAERSGSDQPRLSRHLLIVGDSQVVMGCSRLNPQDRATGKCGWRKHLLRQPGTSRGDFQIDTMAQVGLRAATLRTSFPATLAGVDTSFITEREYELVILQIGGNDIGDGSGSAAAKAETILQLAQTISRSVRARRYAVLSVSPRCVYLGAPRDATVGRRVGRQAYEVNQLLKTRFAGGAPVEFVYLYDQVVAPPVSASDPTFRGCLRPEYAADDQVHSSEAGREVLGRLVAEALF